MAAVKGGDIDIELGFELLQSDFRSVMKALEGQRMEKIRKSEEYEAGRQDSQALQSEKRRSCAESIELSMTRDRQERYDIPFAIPRSFKVRGYASREKAGARLHEAEDERRVLVRKWKLIKRNLWYDGYDFISRK